jgi:hypothetical protein
VEEVERIEQVVCADGVDWLGANISSKWSVLTVLIGWVRI